MMFCKKLIFSLMMFCMIVKGLLGLYSDDYIIGAYSYLTHNAVDAELLMDYLSEAYYNCHVCNNYDQSNSSFALLNDRKELDMLLIDLYWNDDDQIYGTYELTRANNYIYEAEYYDIDQTPFGYEQPCLSHYYYRITRDVGIMNTNYSTNHSNGYTWICNVDQHEAGYAADNLYWKWLLWEENYPLKKHIVTRHKEKLYYDFSMKIANPSPNNTTNICRVNLYTSVIVYDANNNPVDTVKVYLPIYSREPNLYDENELTNEDFYNANNNPDFSEYKLFKFYTPVDSIPEEVIDMSNSEYRLLNFNFEVYWYDNEDLYIDYFRIYDDVYEAIENHYYDNMIANRATELNVENLKYIYSKDEPYPTHFDAYRLVQNAMNNYAEFSTAVHRIGYWAGSNYTNYTYNQHEHFNLIAEPENLMFDSYPCTKSLKWNSVGSSTEFIQGTIDRLLNWYNDVRYIAHGEGIPFYAVPQTYGRYYLEPDNVGEYWRNTMQPPSSMQKCLQFLPLCYDADGIIDYKFVSWYNYGSGNVDDYSEPICESPENKEDSRGIFHRIALIEREGDDNDGDPIKTDQYDAIQEANQKIETYGSIISKLIWEGAGTIETENSNVEFDFSLVDNLDNIEVDGEGTYYDGYIECGLYSDTDSTSSYFMLVNRRTNYTITEYTSTSGYASQIPRDVNSAFEEALNQELTFYFNSYLGNNYHLVDQYTGDIYDIDNLQSEAIPIGPGDGMLLKLCQLPVPQVINSSNSCSIGGNSNDDYVYIPYDVTVQSGGSLIVNGNVEFGPYASLIIEDGGFAHIKGINLFGENSELVVEGVCYVNSQNPVQTELTSKFDSWKGIKCLSSGEVYVENESIIENAETGILALGGNIEVDNSNIENCLNGISLYNQSTLSFVSSWIELQNNTDSKGISVYNTTNTENSVLITGTEFSRSSIAASEESDCGFYIVSYYEDPANDFICEYTNFIGLEYGISHNSTVTTDHIIRHCYFEDCNYGISVFGNGGRIHTLDNCEFDNCDIGIQQNTATCDITDCNFIDCETGIYFQNSQSPFGSSLSASGCEFFRTTVTTTDIKGTDASASIDNCIFRGFWGIQTADNCSFDIAKNAYNVFDCDMNNLLFYPELPRGSSGILLINGHNDFYEPRQNPGQNLNADMGFWGYDGSGIVIDPQNNWFDENDEITIYLQPGSISPNILDSLLDPEPNVQYTQRDITRFEMALDEEYNGNYGIAYSIFESILDDKLESEIHIWDKCIDKIYNLTMTLEGNIEDLLSYYNNLFTEMPSYLSLEQAEVFDSYVKNYKKKCYIALREYNNAADIVIERIENPINPIDSLYAVIQLETIYALSMLDSTGNTLRTAFDCIVPKSLRELNKKHSVHWQLINKLLGLGQHEEYQIIPPQIELYANYPNPFNPVTTISFSIPDDCKVDVSIYNIKGQKVKRLVNEEMEKGLHKIVWDSTDNSGKSVSSGVYFYKLNVNGKDKAVRKCLLLK